MSQATECPKCKGRVVHGFNVGRATCNVCIDCGWCIVHSTYWPSVHVPDKLLEIAQRDADGGKPDSSAP